MDNQPVQPTQPIPSSPPPSQPVPNAPLPEQQSGKKPLLMLLGVILLLCIIGILAYLILFAPKPKKVENVVLAPTPTVVIPTPQVTKTQEELVEEIDTGSPEAELLEIQSEADQL